MDNMNDFCTHKRKLLSNIDVYSLSPNEQLVFSDPPKLNSFEYYSMLNYNHLKDKQNTKLKNNVELLPINGMIYYSFQNNYNNSSHVSTRHSRR
jgi:hypothetical protein